MCSALQVLIICRYITTREITEYPSCTFPSHYSYAQGALRFSNARESLCSLSSVRRILWNRPFGD